MLYTPLISSFSHRLLFSSSPGQDKYCLDISAPGSRRSISSPLLLFQAKYTFLDTRVARTRGRGRRVKPNLGGQANFVALSLRPQTMVTFVSISRVVLESLILSLSPKGGDVTSGWRVALFLLLLFNGFFSDLCSAPRRDSLLLEITSFQRQPRISFRKFIDRRNISRKRCIYTRLLYTATQDDLTFIVSNSVSLVSSEFETRLSEMQTTRDEMRFKSSNGAYASFCLSWTRYPLTLGKGIGRSTIDAFHATATLYPILGVSSRAKRNAF